MKPLAVIRSIVLILLFLTSHTALCEDKAGELEKKLNKEKDKLESIKQKISIKKEKVKKVQKKEKSLLSQLNEIEMALSNKREEVKKLHQAIRRLDKKIKEGSAKLQDLTQKMDDQKHYLNGRIIALYKYTRSGGQVTLLSQSSYYDLMKATKLMEIIINSDHKAIDEFSQNISTLHTYQTTLKEDNEELKFNLSQVEMKEKEIQQKQDEKVALLTTIRREKSHQLAAIKELETSSKDLLELIKQLEREVSEKEKGVPFPGISGFALLKGKLPFPVHGKIISYFGKSQHEELHTTFFQKGIEIAAPAGTDIKAIYAGKVLYADWLKGYGKIIIIDHGNGYYTLSAHTSEILRKVGDEVKAGEPIALVGDTNSLKGSCLYFEIRHHGNPENPLEWLAKSE
jgi:septal ring factor EnvC (AmiA/AmiB activator)